MYQELLNLWRKENDTDKLNLIPKDFKTKIHSYLENLHKLKDSQEKDSLEKEVLEKEIEEFNKLLQNFLKIRLQKIICLTTDGVKLESTHLLVEEQKIIASYETSMKNFYDAFLMTTEEENNAIESEGNSNLIVVRILEDIDQEIVGIDLKNYGPFKKEDIATLPEKNAIPLIEKNVVIPIKMKTE